MFRTSVCMVIIACCGAGAISAAEFSIDLRVDAGKKSGTAHAMKAEIGVKAKARPVLEIKAGQKVQVRWTLRCVKTKKPLEDVTIHFFVVREERTGQRAVPKLGKTVAVESALTSDFKSGTSTEGNLSFTLDRPGSYLVRLETIGASANRTDPEYFAALDLVVR